MKKISFDNGLKSFEVCDNDGNVRGVISFNPSDFGFMARADMISNEIEEFANNIDEDADETIIKQYDELIREKINSLFGSDVCTVMFGTVNCLSFHNGEPLFKVAIETLVEIVKEETNKEIKKGIDNIEKYTKDVVD